MITSLMINKVVNIGVNSKREIYLNINDKDTKLNIDTDIPIIRYKFSNNITNDEIIFIKNNMERFSRSVHILELKYNDYDFGIAKQIRDAKLNIGIIMHVELTETEVINKILDSEHTRLINLKELDIDRIVFDDLSDKIDTIAFNSLVKSFASIHGINKNNIGICGSPLSFNDNCCLNAVKAREIMSKYSSIKDLPLPSSNHQNMNCCGCIRFVRITNDVAVRENMKNNNKKQSVNENKEKKRTPNSISIYNRYLL